MSSSSLFRPKAKASFPRFASLTGTCIRSVVVLVSIIRSTHVYLQFQFLSAASVCTTLGTVVGRPTDERNHSNNAANGINPSKMPAHQRSSPRTRVGPECITFIDGHRSLPQFCNKTIEIENGQCVETVARIGKSEKWANNSHEWIYQSRCNLH